MLKVKGRTTVNAQAKPITSKLEEVVVTELANDKAEYAPRVTTGNYGLAQRKAKKQLSHTTTSLCHRRFSLQHRRLDAITENRFKDVKGNPLSTFSIDVDAASYSNIRRFLTRDKCLAGFGTN
jgi:Ca-activated chloride channel family protein